MLEISEELCREIKAHGERGYPHEICGALLGKAERESRTVVKLFPIENQRQENRERRYVIHPENLMAAEKEGRALQLELLGIYHSHPDHPARPSEYDREHAWPWYSYLIVSVAKGRAELLTSWRLSEDRAAFLPEELEITGDIPAKGESRQ